MKNSPSASCPTRIPWDTSSGHRVVIHNDHCRRGEGPQVSQYRRKTDPDGVVHVCADPCHRPDARGDARPWRSACNSARRHRKSFSKLIPNLPLIRPMTQRAQYDTDHFQSDPVRAPCRVLRPPRSRAGRYRPLWNACLPREHANRRNRRTHGCRCAARAGSLDDPAKTAWCSLRLECWSAFPWQRW